MGIRKSLVDTNLAECVRLLNSLIHDVHLQAGSMPKETILDTRTVTHRANAEGLGYLTKTLPKLGKALDEAFQTGTLLLPQGFKPERGKKTPVFLRGLFRCLFSEDGRFLLRNGLATDAQYEAIRGIRQICFLYYKMETGFEDRSTNRLLDEFVAVDASLPEEVVMDDVLFRASLLLERLFEKFDPKDILPRHGPGSVATGEKQNGKYTFARKYMRIHEYYPYYDYFMVDVGKEFRDRVQWYKSLQQLDQGQAKVCLVPKDSRGPRIISMEPLEYQWIQQGLLRKLVPFIENHYLTKGYVNFTDQSVNQRLASESSVTGEFATLDLKDASDRVSLALVRAIFPDHMLEAFEAARSGSTVLPDGRVVVLKKFAPMGSALCFPVLALTIWALTNAEVQHETASSHCDRARSCFVYGDDILVPVQNSDSTMACLERYNLRVNRGKSYTRGLFRESCGVDAFLGVDVTPYKVKTPLFGGINSPGEQFSALVNGYNSLFGRGYWNAAMVCLETAERKFGEVPYGTSSSGFPCIRVSDPSIANALNLRIKSIRKRWNCAYQRLEYKVNVQVTETVERVIDGWNRLLKSLTTPCVTDPSLVKGRVSLKRRWRSV